MIQLLLFVGILTIGKLLDIWFPAAFFGAAVATIGFIITARL